MDESYQIAEGETISHLMRDVASFIDQGYVPIGGVSVRPPDNSGRSYLIQALVLPRVIEKYSQ